MAWKTHSGLGLWDRIRKSPDQQQAKEKALGAFRATVVQMQESPLSLMRAVLEHAKVDALPLIKASYGDLKIKIGDELYTAGEKLAFSIDDKPVSFEYPELVLSSPATDAADRADAENYALAHAISAQAVKHAKKPDIVRIGALREAIFGALQSTDAKAGGAARADAIGFDPAVRQALNDLGLTTFVVGMQTDKTGSKTFVLADLWDDMKEHIPKARKDDVAQAMDKLVFRYAPGERLLNLTAALRGLADPQKRADFRAGYRTDGGNTSFHFRLGNRKIALPAVPADTQTNAIVRKIAIDSIREPLSRSPFGSASRDLISRLTDAAFPKGTSPAPEALRALSDPLQALLELARTHPKNDAWEQDARRTILAVEQFIAENMQDGPQKRTQLAALEAIADPDTRRPNLFAGSEHGRAVDAEREKARHALARQIAESHAKASGITLAASVDHVSYVAKDRELAGKLAEKLGEAEWGIRTRVNSVAPQVQIQKVRTSIRDQTAALRNADATTVPTVTFVRRFVGNEHDGRAGLFVNGVAVAWAPASDAGARDRAPSPSTISGASRATTVPLGDDDKSRSSSIAGFTGTSDLSGGQSPSIFRGVSGGYAIRWDSEDEDEELPPPPPPPSRPSLPE
ncbi:hypothetical protein ACUSIJ_17155 [Pseudochelatococcus sp. B33]